MLLRNLYLINVVYLLWKKVYVHFYSAASISMALYLLFNKLLRGEKVVCGSKSSVSNRMRCFFGA